MKTWHGSCILHPRCSWRHTSSSPVWRRSGTEAEAEAEAEARRAHALAIKRGFPGMALLAARECASSVRDELKPDAAGDARG